MTGAAEIKIKKIISRTKFESAQKDAPEFIPGVARLGLFRNMSELAEIEALLKKGKKEKAFELVKDTNTNSLAEILLEKGSSLIENEEYDFAITYLKFSEKIPIDDDIKETAIKHLRFAYGKRGNSYFGLKRYDEAIADYTKAIELDPKYAFVYSNRGAIYYYLKRYDEAIADYTKATELDSKYTLAYRKRGNSYLELKRYDEAIADYTKVMELDPKDVLAYGGRGNSYLELKQYDEAIADYTKAIELDQKYTLAYGNRGNSYRGLKRYDEAIADYNKVMELDPKDVLAYHNRGVAYYELKRYDEAIADYIKAIELDHNFDLAHTGLGNSLFMREDYDNAEKEYREAVKINEDSDYGHNGLGLILSKRNAHKDAIAEFKKALKLNTDADFYNNLGCAYAEYGRGSTTAPFRIFNAKRELTKATQEEKTCIDAYKNLTLVCDLLNYELKIFLLRIFIIFFVFALSINLFEPITINRLILILSGVATLCMVLFSLDFTKIEIKSLKLAGFVEARFKYETPKAGGKAVQFAKPK